MKGKAGCRSYLCRHGETANAHEVCLNGHYDVALSERGLTQSRRISESLQDKPVRAVYSSDLQRTLNGARFIAERHGLQPIACPELREISFGKWEGLPLSQLNARYPGELEKRIKQTETFQADGGETFRQLHDRVVPKFREIVQRHPEDTIVIMSHGGVNRIILSHLLDIPLANLFRISQEYAAVNIIQFYPDQAVVELTNGTCLQIP